MSIVKYNNEDDNHLTVVHQNRSLNAVVLYNSLTKNLELVKLDDDHKFDNAVSSGFISDSRRRRSSGASAAPNQNTSKYEFVCPNCSYQCDIIPPTDSQSAKVYSTDGGPQQDGNSTNSDFLRNDYFKILSDIESTSEQNRELITSVIHQSKVNNPLLLQSEIDNIPLELINQGYFKKFFKVLSNLGNGSNGKVLKVEHKLFNLKLGIFALKKIPIGNQFSYLIKILNEVKFLYDLTESALHYHMNNNNKLNNNNIIKYNHVWLEVDQLNEFGPKIPVVFILFEYCDGGTLEGFVESIANPKFDLKKEKLLRKLRKLNKESTCIINNKRYLNNFEIFKIFKDILNGLNYLHELKILHRDLKPSNCLFKTKFLDDYKPIESVDEFDKIPNLLVSDFGESIMENSTRNSTGSTGTLEYCAPELFEVNEINPDRLREFSFKSDIYSLGMILYYLCFNKLPFKSKDDDHLSIKDEIIHSKVLFTDLNEIRNLKSRDKGDLNDLLEDWVFLIQSMVNPIADERPSCEEISISLQVILDKLSVNEDEVEEMNQIETKKNLVYDYNDYFKFAILLGLLSINLKLSEFTCLNNLQYLLIGLSFSNFNYHPYLLLYQSILFVGLIIIKYRELETGIYS